MEKERLIRVVTIGHIGAIAAAEALAMTAKHPVLLVGHENETKTGSLNEAILEKHRQVIERIIEIKPNTILPYIDATEYKTGKEKRRERRKNERKKK